MHRPFVFMNMASSADGKITSATREYPTFTSDHDKAHMDALRAQADAVLVGANTLRHDDPPLHIRTPEQRRERHLRGQEPHLIHVVVSASLSLDPNLGFFSNPNVRQRIVATTETSDPARREALSPHAAVWLCGAQRVDIPALLARLLAQGVQKLLVEGGGELNWDFIAAGAVDDIHITLCPTLIGGRNAPTLLEGTGFSMHTRPRLRLLEARPVGDEIFCHYRVLRPQNS